VTRTRRVNPEHALPRCFNICCTIVSGRTDEKGSIRVYTVLVEGDDT